MAPPLSGVPVKTPLPRQRLVDQAGGVPGTIKRRETAKARPLALAEQHFVQRLEPFAQVLEAMVLADGKGQRLEVFRRRSSSGCVPAEARGA